MMEQKYYLVKFTADYADEFDVNGGEVFYGTIDEYFSHASDVKFPKEVYFGSNEFIVYESLEDYKRCFRFTECSKEFFEEFKKLSTGPLGTIVSVEDY